jgi:hypothetical protein
MQGQGNVRDLSVPRLERHERNEQALNRYIGNAWHIVDGCCLGSLQQL